nr:flagellar hook-length control protein FliK [Quadrisphaera sp. RL12-1S]
MTAAVTPVDASSSSAAVVTPQAVAAPTQNQAAAAPLPTPAAPVAQPAGVAQPAHVAAQLSPQLVALAGRGAGTHKLTLEVKPEAIGSVTVVAHIRPEGTRIELVGGSPAARDALQASLDDLRKDLAATGSGASLDVSTGSGAAARQDRAPRGWLGSQGSDQDGDGERVVELTPVRLKVGSGRVDVLA